MIGAQSSNFLSRSSVAMFTDVFQMQVGVALRDCGLSECIDSDDSEESHFGDSSIRHTGRFEALAEGRTSVHLVKRNQDLFKTIFSKYNITKILQKSSKQQHHDKISDRALIRLRNRPHCYP